MSQTHKQEQIIAQNWSRVIFNKNCLRLIGEIFTKQWISQINAADDDGDNYQKSELPRY